MNKKKTTEMYPKKGSAIAYGLVIIAVVSIILASTINFVVSQMRYGYRAESSESAFQIAESGISFYRWYLAHNTDGKTSQQIKDFWDNQNPLGVGSVYEADYENPETEEVVGKYSIEVTPPEDDSLTVFLEVTGWTNKYPDTKRTIRIRLRRPSWSEYIALTNEFSRFGDGTEVHGKIFSNSGVHFDGVIYNKVFSAVDTYYDSDSDVHEWKPGVWTSWSGEYNTNMGDDVFLAGYDFPVPQFDFDNLQADLSLIKDEAKFGNGYYFNNSRQGRHIILKNDGTFSIRTVKTFNNNTNSITKYDGGWDTYPIPDDGVIYVEDNIWLEGEINNSRLTIAAANLLSSSKPDIFIEHSIEYTNYDGSDVLGVISQGDVEVIRGSDDILRLDGAIISQEGRVGRKYYTPTWCGAPWCEDHKDTITLFGSMATNERYGFAYTDGTGYDNRILEFDNNLLYLPPPFFPTGDKYLIDLWEEL